MSTILVVTEIREGQLKQINFEVYTAASKIAQQKNQKLATVILGENVATFSEAPGKFGVESVVLVEDPGLGKYSPDSYAAVIAEIARQKNVSMVLMGATSTGKDLMPRVATLLDTTLVQDIIDFRIEGDEVIFTRPMYAGKVRAKVRVTSSPQIATLRPKVFKPEENPVSSSVEKVLVKIPEPMVVVEEMIASTGGKLDVTEADIIVSGGRGMKGPENWHLIENLAEVLGAATGCSRPVSDEGWRDHGEHIGQTGKTVSPVLYIACGISGAIQHIAGMSSSKYIVAINKDPEAPIFKVADYGIIGDVFEVLPALTEEIKKFQSET